MALPVPLIRVHPKHGIYIDNLPLKGGYTNAKLQKLMNFDGRRYLNLVSELLKLKFKK